MAVDKFRTSYSGPWSTTRGYLTRWSKCFLLDRGLLIKWVMIDRKLPEPSFSLENHSHRKRIMTHPTITQPNIEDFFQVLGNFVGNRLTFIIVMIFLFRSMVTETTNNFKISLMFKNRNQRRKRNPYSYAKGLISIFIMTNPPVQSTGTHDKFGVRQTGRPVQPNLWPL